ncbi:hypothetical protein MBOT_37870 [Mycobacterium botniense]|uniref:Uncharacterized protein n=1 Tax=Mycobacterium botniense TaxID=84962 RepID=A0A7I9Y2X4_9MYCO|nr:hypothetical protein MBOT_37870 [Mycobacterium botniense]
MVIAAASAPSVMSRRTLVSIAPPVFRQPMPGVYKRRACRHSGNKNLFSWRRLPAAGEGAWGTNRCHRAG